MSPPRPSPQPPALGQSNTSDGKALLDQVLLQFKSSADTAGFVVQILNVLGPKVDPRSRRALNTARREVAGETAGGRPPFEDDASLARIRRSIDAGVDEGAAIRAEARRITGRGEQVESHRRRLERKIKKSDKTP